MLAEIVIAGFGGQGVMVAGQLLAHAGMEEGRQVAWIPSYGPEMRGGTANCTVIISDEEIGSPIVTNPAIVIAMNRPSLDKYEPLVRPGGLLLVNSSIVSRGVTRDDIEVVPIAANDEAAAMGNVKLANSIMLGALLGRTRMVKMESLVDSMAEVLSARQRHLIDLNRQALARGAELVKPPARRAA
ncbi:MAG: 2-oxoacid:acceptor oxidoreductase family protein [Dehalococcoidales bacterium]|nr:2-oxoacid:acceptor oxidoreductase family protein [Dehalococcoidales bacterium]